jgi:hypothetical protein
LDHLLHLIAQPQLNLPGRKLVTNPIPSMDCQLKSPAPECLCLQLNLPGRKLGDLGVSLLAEVVQRQKHSAQQEQRAAQARGK